MIFDWLFPTLVAIAFIVILRIAFKVGQSSINEFDKSNKGEEE